MRTNPVRGCFDNMEGLNNEHLPSRCGPRVCELPNGLRLWHHGAESGSEWILDHHAWVRASKGKCVSIGPDMG
jgi:hypothetical protein